MLTTPTTFGLLVVFVVLLIVQYVVNAYRTNEEEGVLDPVEWRPLQLVDKKVVSHNTRRFRLAQQQMRFSGVEIVAEVVAFKYAMRRWAEQ